MKADARVVQRQEEEELMQGKFLHSHAEPAGPLQREAGPAAAGRQAGGRGLPSGLQAGVEAMSGMSMSDVNVVRDSGEPARVGALAFAEGDTIHLAPGQERHLPHEAWHVVQQRQGRVAPTGEVAGRPLNDDAGLEREADAMGAQAGRRSTAEGLSVKQKNM